jgi:hypothetical protein
MNKTRRSHTLPPHNISLARGKWPHVSETACRLLQNLTEEFLFSVARGDLLLLEGGWYVTHAGLLGLAQRKRCCGISTRPVTELSRADQRIWTFESVVYTSKACKGFSGFGDASPANVPEHLRGCEMRIAETRAVNRALRKAYAVGICSFEELGNTANTMPRRPPASATSVRDRLLAIIHHHSLDTQQVKAYALAELGTTDLRRASREQMERFVQQLSEEVSRDREQLVAKLANLNIVKRSA